MQSSLSSALTPTNQSWITSSTNWHPPHPPPLPPTGTMIVLKSVKVELVHNSCDNFSDKDRTEWGSTAQCRQASYLYLRFSGRKTGQNGAALHSAGKHPTFIQGFQVERQDRKGQHCTALHSAGNHPTFIRGFQVGIERRQNVSIIWSNVLCRQGLGPPLQGLQAYLGQRQVTQTHGERQLSGEKEVKISTLSPLLVTWCFMPAGRNWFRPMENIYCQGRKR